MAYKNLILTGWFHPEYAAAAAAVLDALRGNADVLGCSMGKLAATLSTKAEPYESIYILGIGLTKNLDQLADALRALNAAGKKVYFFSHIPFEDATKEYLTDAFGSSMGFTEIFLHTKRRDLVEVVGEAFDSLDDATIKKFSRFSYKVTKAERKRHEAEWAFQYLFEAAGYFHRECSNDFIYSHAIRQLWNSQRKEDLDRNTELKSAMTFYESNGGDEIIGNCPAIKKVLRDIERVAQLDEVSVLILGESGSGKDLVARQLHRKSQRFQDGKHIIAAGNCACMGGDLASSMLFGHKKGSFTGADSDYKGLFEQANDSTLFLDEIGELPLSTQAMLLRTLSTRMVYPLGGDINHPISVNVRLVAATNRNLPDRIRKGKFRSDLFQRISTVIINLPPLRERGDDIQLIAEHLWRKITEDPKARLTSAQIAALKSYSWPGNIRELGNILKRAFALNEMNFQVLIDEQKALMAPLEKGVLEDSVMAVEIVGNSSPVQSLTVEEKGGQTEGDEPREEPIPDDQSDLLHWHASRIYEKAHHNLTEGAKLWGTSVNTFKKYAPKE